MRVWVVLLGPAVIVTCIGLVMLRRQTRGAADAQKQNRQFLIYVAGGGCLAEVLMILVVLAGITSRAKTPWWLFFAPWVFALGQAIGLVLWKRRTTRVVP